MWAGSCFRRKLLSFRMCTVRITICLALLIPNPKLWYHFKDGKNIGQIDIDSHTIDPFTDEDTELWNGFVESSKKFCKIIMLELQYNLRKLW